MTKKHYIAIAKAFADNRPSGYYLEEPPNTSEDMMWHELVVDIAYVLMADNPRFDMDLFKAACHQ